MVPRGGRKLSDKREGEDCGPCFNPGLNFDCGSCEPGLECVQSPENAKLPDAPATCQQEAARPPLPLINS